MEKNRQESMWVEKRSGLERKSDRKERKQRSNTFISKRKGKHLSGSYFLESKGKKNAAKGAGKKEGERAEMWARRQDVSL